MISFAIALAIPCNFQSWRTLPRSSVVVMSSADCPGLRWVAAEGNRRNIGKDSSVQRWVNSFEKSKADSALDF